MSTGLQLIAEIGSVHDGSLGNAIQLIETAAEVGANAVKFQLHIPDAEMLRDAPSPSYFSDEDRYGYFLRTAFKDEDWARLRDRAASVGLRFVVSPFSIEAVDLLEDLDVDAYKVASGEVSNIPLLEKLSRTDKPLILSSGMSSWAELDRAVEALTASPHLTILQCSSIYPCPPESVGLNVMVEMRERYDLPVGLSDHTLGHAAAICAVYLGAGVIEKHLTLSRRMYGSDAKHSMEPNEFGELAEAVREAETLRKHPVDKNNVSLYSEMKVVFEKSIVTTRTIQAGSVLSSADLACKKPGDGIPAARLAEIAGRRVVRTLPSDYKIAEEDLT